MKITTEVGYEFEMRDDPSLEEGEWLMIPDPKVEEDNSLSDVGLNFLAQYYGYQKRANNVSSSRHGAHPDMKVFPDSVLNLPLDRLGEFVTKMASAGCYIFHHRSGAGDNRDQPEVWFRFRHPEAARQMQWMLLRLRVKTRIYYHNQIQLWLVKTSGIRSYVRMIPFLKATKNPKVVNKVKDFQWMVKEKRSKLRRDDGRVWDGVRVIIRDED